MFTRTLKSHLTQAAARAAVALMCGCVLELGSLVTSRAVEPASAAQALIGTIVHYVSETPYRWEAGNPLETMARALGDRWASIDAAGDKLGSIQRQQSAEDLYEAARTGRPEPKRNSIAPKQRQVFVLHGYEYCSNRAWAGFNPLLVAAKDGVPATVEFVVLCRKGEHQRNGVQFHWSRLEDKEVRVHRGDCGDLVNQWIDLQTFPVTGRKGAALASLRSAENASEAILSVYFGEAEACLVTRESFEREKRHNRAGLMRSMEIVAHSAPMLRYVAAASENSLYSLSLRKQYVDDTAHLPLDMPGEGRWSLIPARSEHFASLEEFTRQREKVFGPARPAPAAAPARGGVPATAAGGAPPLRAVADERRPK